ncbi:MAG: ribosome rescue GTPase HflX [Legionella sp.]
MFERPQGGEKAILVQLAKPAMNVMPAFSEFKELAISADAQIVGAVQGVRAHPDAKYYMGLGKAEEVRDLVRSCQADLVLINHELSPSQERNLERLFQCRVVDRSGLILDIFAQRARTFEGKLQVELAQLQHMSTRLIRGWTHLERQKGGIGLRGPGETQLETDRRLLRERIRSINQKLEKVRRSRDQNRQARMKAAMPTISLVGYTNAGKSSLFNALTGCETYAADKLFATLDPTMRKLDIPGANAAIIVDTVGFISDLPHHLVDAFRATLEETLSADLLLHVIDVSDLNWRDNVLSVEKVLQDIGADSMAVIQVFNKIDLQEGWKATVDCSVDHCKVWLSARSADGIDLLRQTIAQKLYGEIIKEEIHLDANRGKLRAQLYEMDAVIDEKTTETGWQLLVSLTSSERNRLFNSD